ncbi:trehalose-phosphatase [Azospirillum picis]|uniref:Trehalose 6-phosphate phosphatase n=1 Tax=Azospirillum picis TaxID=488438 RepID=A0ABU0MR20_9PROT|nr:trehalose-phosphatase [Azospirillum picis]MBP2302326.1 trehalose 6-phosphate phosphatase [Azospirillum picis]MDQ0535905.1 trehalose 6-phosphate phosphatase [Azospirillum picis]
MALSTPSAFAEFDAFTAALDGRRPALFLDYDGTLAAIAPRPELAVMPDGARAVVRRLAALCPVAFVSGRDLDDLTRMVAVDGLVYAGSHGFDLRGPGLRRQVGVEYLGDLDTAEGLLRDRLGGFTGVLVERKRFAIAVHTRQAAPGDKPAVADAVRTLVGEQPRLRLTGGKELYELRPDLPWDKGRAVLALLETLGLQGADTLPVYLGDDETDEDAFRALAEHGPSGGIGIRVMEEPAPTAATWSLRDPDEAVAFLGRLADWLAAA